MATRPALFRAPGAPATRREANREFDRRRGSARDRLYDAAWDRASLDRRRSNPLCEYCEVGAFGPVRVSPAELTDHLYPHHGNPGLFWHRELWVSACADCHNGPKQALERRGLPALNALALQLGRPLLCQPVG